MRPYKSHVVPVFRAGDKAKRVEFSDVVLRNMEDDNFASF